MALGGYEGAERTILLFLPDWLEAEDAESQSPLRFLRASFRREYHLTHRVSWAASWVWGSSGEKVGDIPGWARTRQTSSSGQRGIISAGELDLRRSGKADGLRDPGGISAHPQVRCEEMRDTVSSLRLDAVASTGFRLARGKAAALIESGKVGSTGGECTKPDHLLAEGDTVSARGFGKFELTEVGGTTKKGRISIVVKRFI